MEEKKSSFSTILFVVILCSICALVLSLTSEFLKTPQRNAKELYKSKQLLLASQILSYEGYFLLNDQPAIYNRSKKMLLPFSGKKPPQAKDDEILTLFEKRVLPRLTNNTGELFTFEEVGIDKDLYIEKHAKLGYAYLPYKLLYVIKENFPSPKPYGYVIPINGYGLWDAIYGYLGVEANGDTVLGMTWYSQKETPGLGGEIALPEWQEQFIGKSIFQKSPDGTTQFERASLGIKVVKTTVEETLGDSPRAKSAVDGIAGASETVRGVNEAYRSSLNPYRPFLIRAHNLSAGQFFESKKQARQNQTFLNDESHSQSAMGEKERKSDAVAAACCSQKLSCTKIHGEVKIDG